MNAGPVIAERGRYTLHADGTWRDLDGAYIALATYGEWLQALQRSIQSA